jgi:hypothetical protein
VAVVPDARPSREALLDLKARLKDAIRDRSPVDSPDLAAELIEVSDLAAWCRDAGLAWVRTGCTWGEISQATGISDATLQSRWTNWYKRGGFEECG